MLMDVDAPAFAGGFLRALRQKPAVNRSSSPRQSQSLKKLAPRGSFKRHGHKCPDFTLPSPPNPAFATLKEDTR